MTRNKTDNPTTSSEPNDAEIAARIAAGKGRATPTRKEREAANKRPLVPGDRKLAAKEARAKMAEAREKARLGYAAGDEKFLPARDRGAQKKYIRDFVDARFNVGEFLIPVMFVVILLTLVPSADVQVYALLGIWAFFLLALVDVFLLGRSIRKRLAAKFGETKVERGVRWYAAMRSLQLRVLRLPKPQVKRRQYPE
ncbi:DUF3043 domain-containing protein [Labedella endophytica]|uniref:DUF3043 domain-containing protein n=1 Tax=Labedella endophytica TaxID=1523160 RepID=A0A433JN15_9MICO|nr:DUF3043 domain-containing protein [Labedella endophytica]RUQ97122.1 DUF3043 domain-containing protein [Labedella endophytica]